MNKFAFLDRDGVINQDNSYVYRIEDFKFLRGIFSLCKTLKTFNYKIAIITNQSGIGRGLYTEEQYNTLKEWMLDKFYKRNIEINYVMHCPYHPESIIKKYRKLSNLRKPDVGMIEQIDKIEKINRQDSIIIGDQMSDIMCGYNANLKYGILINKKFQGFKTKLKNFNYFEVNSLTEATKVIHELNV